MLTPEDLTKMHCRKHAAKAALRYFKDIVPVRSSNSCSPFTPPFFSCISGQEIIETYRRKDPPSIWQRTAVAADTGFGNCSEKTIISYSSLWANPTLLSHSKATIYHLTDVSHMFILVTDQDFRPHATIRTYNLNKTAMIVDPWTNDWYFPNLDKFTAYTNHLGNVPNPWQLHVRYNIAHSQYYQHDHKGIPLYIDDDNKYYLPEDPMEYSLDKKLRED